MIRTLLMTAVLTATVHAADPPDVPFGESPPVSSPQPRPEPERTLSRDRVRLIWLTQPTGPVPVRWTITSLDGSAAADLFVLDKAQSVIGLGDGESRARVHQPPASACSAVAVWGVSPGRIVLTADGVRDGRIVTLVRIPITITGNSAPTPQPPPPVPPPKSSLFLLIVRPSGPAAPEFARIMADPAWDEHRRAGRLVKSKTLDELNGLIDVPAGTVLPCVFVLNSNDRTGRSELLRGPLPLPTTSDGIRRLTEGTP